LPPGLTKQLDHILRQCLWRDQDGEPKQSPAAWEIVCKPKLKGGLGIINFDKQNDALLIKFLDKVYNKKDIPWVQLIWYAHYPGKLPHEEKLAGSFWWRDVLRQVDNFRGMAVVTHGRGDTISFWNDNWNIAHSALPRVLDFQGFTLMKFNRLFLYLQYIKWRIYSHCIISLCLSKLTKFWRELCRIIPC
jgi:hypothetical protein